MNSQVDHAELKLGQILTIAIAIAAIYLTETRLLIALAIIFLVSGTPLRPISPFVLLYRIIKPLGIIKSDYRLDNIQPHKFGQIVGVATVVTALVLIQLDYAMVGWSVVWVLIGLTAISYSGWCIGCFMYYQINRMGFNGFFSYGPTDKAVFLGKRPRKK